MCRAVNQQQQQQAAAAAAGAFGKFASQAYLDKAAQRFRVGLENGLSEDDLVAIELGATCLEELSEAQRGYVDKLKAKLYRRVEELKREEAERRAREARWLEAGKEAYERGEYADAVKAFERSVEENGRDGTVGGDSLMWLALAYQAVGREADCVDTYKWIEANHPLPRMRKQAENLRYIMEAPKLELSPDERVQIPLLSDTERVAWRRDGRKPASSRRPAGGGGAKKEETYWDKVQWEAKLPFVPDRWYYRVLWAALLVGATVYANYLSMMHAAGR